MSQISRGELDNYQIDGGTMPDGAGRLTARLARIGEAGRDISDNGRPVRKGEALANAGLAARDSAGIRSGRTHLRER